MNTHKRYDWNEIQKAYDSGLSYIDLSRVYGITKASLTKASSRGSLKPRTLSESSKLANNQGKYDRLKIWTPERRKLQSEAKKKLYRDHPEKHPNRKLANNRQKMSYPEKIVYDWLTLQGIEFIHQRRIETYYVDFNIGLLCIEIDGKYFHDAEYDAIRDSKIEALGFSIKRISASNIIKHGGSIVLDDSISPELLATPIDLRKPKVCSVCSSIYYGNRKSCSLVCKKQLKLTHPTTVKTKSGIKIINTNALPPISKNELLSKLNSGESFTSIGKEYGVSDNGIRRWCKKYDIDFKRQNPIDESKLIEMVNTGIGVSEIAREFEVTRERIQNITKKLGLTIVNKKPEVTPPETVEKIRELISKGQRNVEIAKLVGMDHKQISAIRMRFALIDYH